VNTLKTKLLALGFEPYNAGGGCLALAYFRANRSHALVTDDDGISCATIDDVLALASEYVRAI